ncbi:MAG: exodeoxyribonuclease VII large subunit [Tatlockia sp.]|nr:exodeoxyribonuclease VII large subunit [Tatlockia sp.]
MNKEQPPLTVTQLNRLVRSWLELELGEILVIGELSNLAKPSSGHFYFCLKDSSAQIRCVYFRNQHDINSKAIKDGQKVIAKGKLSLYEARGDYQLIVQSLSEAGLGELYYQFEQLKAKLQAQGLFDQARKRSLPPFPCHIAVVTSSSGAALQDILTTLNRRYPLAQVKLYASEVQGKEAALHLVKALNKANEDRQADVILLARGGGSIEDLWAFNDENLALTIYNSAIPIVTGIGHETDFTIADFVADLRAATPTAAAEAVTPNQIDLLNKLRVLEERIIRSISRFMQQQQLLLSYQVAKFLSPSQLISKYWQNIDYFERQLNQTVQGLLHHKQKQLHLLSTNLNARNPMANLKQAKGKLEVIEQHLTQTMQAKLQKLKQTLSSQMATLHAVSPLATLDRGYALATCEDRVLFNSSQVKIGDIVNVRLAKGSLSCRVLDKKDKEINEGFIENDRSVTS